jgi:nitrogen fixation/metabolism regulation signal transduction histidine kinase
MRKIRSKIVLILLLIVFLPMIPISLMVYDLIDQSYRIGMNAEVQRALETGLSFSKVIYENQRKRLSDRLDQLTQWLPRGRDRVRTEFIRLFLEDENPYWRNPVLIYLNESGNELWRFSVDSLPPVPVDMRTLKEMSASGRERLIVSNRSENIYTAIQKIDEKGQPVSYLLLQASIDPNVLEQSDYLLEINQIYQSLDLRRTDLMRSFFLTFILIGAFLVSAAVITGIWISSRITAPVSQVVAATAELGKGNLDYRLPQATGGDEVSQLMNHFNQMAEALEENQERLIYLEKRAAWQQMARKIAHEIKNPLTPIQLTIQQLVDKYPGSEDTYHQLLKECAGIINEEIGSLRQLVTEFSEFGRMPELHLQSGDLNEILREMSTLYSGRVQLKLDEKLPKINFDYDRIRRVLINLVENAIQADSDEQPVSVISGVSKNVIQVSVKDLGEGISPENLSRIFEPYYSTKKTGTGLGLAISRLIIEEHGGRISVQSTKGAGTIVILEFPLEGSEA